MNGPDGTGRNPLALAIGYKQDEVVEVLQKPGAEDSTPLHLEYLKKAPTEAPTAAAAE